MFPPDSALRAITSELALLLGGGRALLLQLAHPLIAAGVADHSHFQAAPQARLERTLDLMLTLSLGTWGEGRPMLRRFHAVHVPIIGTLPYTAGPFPAGTPYNADDPALRLWVAATLLDTSLLGYELFVGPLSPQQRQAFYADSTVFARRLGIPASVWPPTLAAFQAYMRTMLASDILTVTPTARRLAHEVLHPQVGILPRAGAHLLGWVAAGMLPPRLRRAYGLRWTARRQAQLTRGAWLGRHLLPLLPRGARYVPQAGGSRLVEWILRQGRSTARH